MSNNNLNQARECCLRENNLCGKTKLCETSCRYMRNIARLWDGFCDTPVEYDGCIKEEWNTFPIGTARANIVDWFYKTFEVDIDALKEMTEREINTDIGDHRQKSVYEIYAEQTTVEEMEKAWKTFQKEKQNTWIGYKNLKDRLHITNGQCIIYLERLIGIDFRLPSVS